jgi:uncharacterized protein YjeT (DUF2065 family)
MTQRIRAHTRAARQLARAERSSGLIPCHEKQPTARSAFQGQEIFFTASDFRPRDFRLPTSDLRFPTSDLRPPLSPLSLLSTFYFLLFFPNFALAPLHSRPQVPRRSNAQFFSQNFMKQELILKRLLELAGLVLIADGLMSMLRPRRHSLLWHFGPQLAKAVTEELADHPKTSRAVYAAELVAGVALASVQLNDLE